MADQPPPAPIDHFDRLPNELKLRILDVLPIRAVLRTEVLSHRWRNLWPSISRVNLDEDYSAIDAINFGHLTSRLLYDLEQTVQEVNIHIDMNEPSEYMIKNWLRILLPKCVGHPRLEMVSEGNNMLHMPSELFQFELQKLSLSSFIIRRPTWEWGGFTHLTELYLQYIEITNIMWIIGNCPVLERLILGEIDTVLDLVIQSETLRYFKYFGTLEVLTLNAPRLNQFDCNMYGDKDDMDEGRLDIGAFTSNIQSLIIRNFWKFTGLMHWVQMDHAATVGSLREVYIGALCLDDTPDVLFFIRAFGSAPLLEKLSASVCTIDHDAAQLEELDVDFWQNVEANIFKRLKLMHICCFIGTPKERLLVGLVLARASRLKRIYFTPVLGRYTDGVVESATADLATASANVQVVVRPAVKADDQKVELTFLQNQ